MGVTSMTLGDVIEGSWASVRLGLRIALTVRPKCVWKLVYNFGWKAMWAVEAHKKRMKQGEVFPPFLYLSILNSCNLRCQGCWVDVEAPRNMITAEELNRTINSAKRRGNYFFGILGGEPFMHPELLDVVEMHPDCYFQIFTNGQLITKKVAERLAQAGNATPLISIEGREVVSDERRGKKDVYERTVRGVRNCLDAGLLTGIATSLCQTNIDELLNERWLRELIKLGVHYAWYHTYRPVGASNE